MILLIREKCYQLSHTYHVGKVDLYCGMEKIV